MSGDPAAAAVAAAAAAATAAAAGAPAESVVFVKAAGARGLGKQFAEVAIFGGDTVARLAKRVSAAFPAWNVGAEDVALFLVPAEHEVAVAAGEVGPELLVLAAVRPLSSISALSAVGVRDRSCLLARLPDPPAPAADGGGRGTAPLSYESVVGPTFEHEARQVLGSVFRDVCPWMTGRSEILSRTLDRDGNGREGDLMCYLEGDTLGPCVSAPVHGVRVIEVAPPNVAASPMPPVALPAAVQFSPTDPSRRGPHKYFIGEAYSGVDGAKMRDKVAQLESLCGFLRQRWEEQHGQAVGDLTEIVGAVALVFSAGEKPRRVVLDDVAGLVSRHATGASLRRLIAAGRLFVAVLEKGQSPNTFFQRAIAAELKAVSSQMKSASGQIAAVKGDIAAVKEGVEAILAAQRSAAAAAGSVGNR